LDSGLKEKDMPSIFRGSDDFDTAGGNAVKAWVNFNGTGTPAIRAAYNVASITDNGTGDYTVNFTTALPDANYSAVGVAGLSLSVGGFFFGPLTNAPTTSAYRFVGTNFGGGFTDLEYVSLAFFR
jgi:hypothetical protein